MPASHSPRAAWPAYPAIGNLGALLGSAYAAGAL